MTAGIPGAAVGGLFYLVSALLMPVRELVCRIRDPQAPRRWEIVQRQSGIAAGILVAIWAVGRALGWLLHPDPIAASEPVHRLLALGAGPNIVRVSALVLSFGTLILVLGAIQVLRLLVRRPDQRGGMP